MTLEEVRAGIDAVDTQMKPLFLKRMECGKHVAEVKAQTGLSSFPPTPSPALRAKTTPANTNPVARR